MNYYRITRAFATGAPFDVPGLVVFDDDAQKAVVLLDSPLPIWLPAQRISASEAARVAKDLGAPLPTTAAVAIACQLSEEMIRGARATTRDEREQRKIATAEGTAAERTATQGRVRASDWKHLPISDPQPIPPPPRVWTRTEWERIRAGHLPLAMEDHWFAYTVGTRLHLHRSWTGYEIYAVEFSGEVDGNRHISSATVSADARRYSRGSDAYEMLMLEYLIHEVLLGVSAYDLWERAYALKEFG